MKTAKTILAMVLMVSCLSLILHTAGSSDILDFLPAFISRRNCNFPDLKQMFLQRAQQAAAQVNSGDKTQVMNYVSLYPEGNTPPQVVETSTDYDVQVTSKAAAFYVIGAKAVLQGNKQVALWCFCEAAWRNPREPTFLNNAAFVFLEFGYYADAKKALECAQSLAPDFNSVYVNLGGALTGLGDYAGAADNYRKAYYNFPTNGEYLRLAAQAYKQAGMDGQAYVMAQLGQSNFPTLMDWTAFINSLNFPTTPPACPYGTDCTVDPVCLSFYLSEEFNPHHIWVAWDQQYRGTVRDPALDHALTQKGICELNAQNAAASCPPSYTPEGACCGARMLTVFSQCGLTYDSNVYYIYQTYYAQARSAWEAACKQIEANINKMQGTLTANQIAFLQCELNNTKASFYEGLAQGEAATQTTNLANISISRMNVANSVEYADAICQMASAYRSWLLTGQVTTGFEPTYCLAILCFSYDTVSNNIGASISFGPAIKLTYNPFTHDLGLNVGLGLKIGAGPYNLGGAIWFKFNNNKIGVEPKLNFGFSKVSYFLGFERV